MQLTINIYNYCIFYGTKGLLFDGLKYIYGISLYCFSYVYLVIKRDIKRYMSNTFGKRLRECREVKKLSQQELGKLMNTSYTVIGKYERDETKPSIDVARNMAKLLDTTVGHLLGEIDDKDVLKDPAMLKRLNELNELSAADREGILYALDGLLRDAKARKAYAH